MVGQLEAATSRFHNPWGNPKVTLAPRRFVDALRDDRVALLVRRQIDEERRVRAVRHTTEHDDVARLQDIERDIGRERPAFTKG